MIFLKKCSILTLHICLGGILAAENIVVNETKETYEIAKEIKQLRESNAYIKSYLESEYKDTRQLLDMIQRAKLVANKDESQKIKEQFIYGYGFYQNSVQISQIQAPMLHTLIKELADKTQLQIPFVFISFDESLYSTTAFTFSPSLTSIIIGEGLINKLSDKQLKMFIAREFGHLVFDTKNRKSCFDRFITRDTIPLTYLACMLSLFFLMRPDWEDIKHIFNRFKNMGTLSKVLLGSPWFALAIIGYVTYLRKNSLAVGETQADQTAIDITQDPESFVAAMEFLKEKNIKDLIDYNNNGLALVEENLKELKELSVVLYNKLAAKLKNKKDSTNIEIQKFLDDGTYDYPGINRRIERGKREIEKYKHKETTQPVKTA